MYKRQVYTKRGLAPLLAGVLLLAPGCLTNPETGRTSINFFSEQEDIALGEEAYPQILAGEAIITGGAQYEMVERVMQNLAAVSNKPGYPWEVVLIDAPDTINAFALPGGKMAVYTGILPVAQTEAGLAVVMGHEIAHATARHGTSRLSTQEAGAALIEQFAGDYAGLAEAGFQFLVGMPWGRGDESEADRIGQRYMARAGYDPAEAIRFWERMNAATGGGGPPAWLSTHPSHEQRVADLERWLPEAMAEYRP